MKMQTNKEKVKHIISWSLLAVIAQVKLKESAGSDLEAGPSSELGQSEPQLQPQPLASKPPHQRKNYAGMTESTSKTSGHHEGRQYVGKQNQDTIETRGTA